MRHLLFIAVSFLLAHCDGKTTEKDNAENLPSKPLPPFENLNPTYYGATKSIIEESCVGCHTKGGIAPFSLAEYADVKTFKNLIKPAIDSLKMPPWLADSGHQKYRGDKSLTLAQKSVLYSWLDNGLPLGNLDEYNPAKREVFKSDVSYNIFAKDESYEPAKDRSDDYRCFIVDSAKALVNDPSYITGFIGHPGNREIVHHLVAYVANENTKEIFHDFDDAEPGLGYQCFGGALPDQLGDLKVRKKWEEKYPDLMERLDTNHYWLAHWAPGMDQGLDFPENTGIPFPENGIFILQIHYHTHGHQSSSDSGTSFGLKTAQAVEKPAFYYPLTEGSWLSGNHNGNEIVVLPQSSLTVNTSVSLSQILARGQSVLKLNKPVKNIEVHGANLHMHRIGSSGKVLLTHNNEEPTTLLSISQWNLDWQRDFILSEPLKIPPAQADEWQNQVECTFKNPFSETVYGGFGSEEEMCFNFGFYAFSLEE